MIRTYNCTPVLNAIDNGNEAPVLNLLQDIATGIIFQSWIILELVVKDLLQPNYATLEGEYTCNYHANSFGFSTREKKGLDLFYYLRNAIVHTNGAFNTSKEIDHTFAGVRFKSDGNLGF